MFLTIKKEDWFLLYIFVLTSLSILAKSFFTHHGYLTSDSMSYLGTAQNLLDINSKFIDNNFSPKWPLGYPMLIFFTAKISGLSVFWSSKILNIVLIGSLLLLFRFLFKKNAYLYGLIFFFSAYIEIFAYTWSEAVFIFLLTIFSISIYKLVITHRTNYFIYFILFVSSLSLFLSRYIGAFSFIIIGILMLYYFYKKDMGHKPVILAIVLLTNLIFMVLYLHWNYISSGSITGQRYLAAESNLELLIMLLKAIIAEMAIPIHRFGLASLSVVFFQLLILIFLFFRYRQSIKKAILNSKTDMLVLSFSVVGFSYLIAIVSLRWLTFFDPFSFRLLAPGTFLLLIALIKYISNISTIKGREILSKYILVFSLLSLFLFLPIRTLVKFDPEKGTYQTFKENIYKKYNEVKNNSIVINGSYHLTYLRTDIMLEYPNVDESWTDFLERISIDGTDIYIVIQKRNSYSKPNDFILKLLQEYEEGELVKIN